MGSPLSVVRGPLFWGRKGGQWAVEKRGCVLEFDVRRRRLKPSLLTYQNESIEIGNFIRNCIRHESELCNKFLVFFEVAERDKCAGASNPQQFRYLLIPKGFSQHLSS